MSGKGTIFPSAGGNVRAAVVGASGFTGVELLRLLAGHPMISVDYVSGDSSAGRTVESLYPSLASKYRGVEIRRFEAADIAGFDLVFLAMPHGIAMKAVPGFIDKVGVVVDLSADFRLKDATSYPDWYGFEHTAPDLLKVATLGIPELFREQISSSKLVASAGCYVTSASLALAPLTRAGVIETRGIIVDAASGVSGAGNPATQTTHFSFANEDFRAYGLLNHRHTPEIEQATGAQVLFTPHLAPMTRGILSTCYARPTKSVTTGSVLEVLGAFYDGEPFVQVVEEPPSTKSTSGSNTAVITARVDERTGWVVVLSALDNLVKGASGQAIQCANVALGLEETSGLPTMGLFP